MEEKEAEGGGGSCYHGAVSEEAHALAADQGVVGELVPMKGVTVMFAAIMCVSGLVLAFILSIAWHMWRHRDDL